MNEFERKLQRQQRRHVPSAWREGILAEAAAASPRESRSSAEKPDGMSSCGRLIPAPLGRWTPKWSWSEWLWPAPQAWVALAAVWLLLAALVAFAPDDPPRRVVAAPPPDDVLRAGSLLAWHDAQRVAAELDPLR
jgi:hypothetical protein